MYLAGMSTMTTDAPTAAVREQRVAYVATEPAPPPTPVSALQGPILWRCDVATFEKIIALGLLDQVKCELIDGIILEKMAIGDPHAKATRGFRRVFKDVESAGFLMGSQEPIVLPDFSRPEPDGWIAQGPLDRYDERSPLASEIVLVVEVSESTLPYDRTTKLSIYARAAIPEYWIVNLVDQQLERHRGPREDGTYDRKEVLRFGESLESEVWGEVEVTQLFG